MPESSPIAASPVAACAARAFSSAISAKESPSSGGSSTPSGSGSSSSSGSSSRISRSLCLLAVAKINDRYPPPATRSCTCRKREIPISARPSSSSSEARESGVRSAVACTSTRPPSPVITTLASTSAVESSE